MPVNGIPQWGWSELEELLQCPICLDIPGAGIVEQCRHGHHICANCKKQVDSCPLCKCSFHGTRNFVVEELVRHFEVLKNTMLLHNIVTEAVKPKKKGKTKLNATAPAFIPNLPVLRRVHTPNAMKGIYPCRVSNCNVDLPASRLLNHVRSAHSDILTEAIVDFTDSYNTSWEIPFVTKHPINANTFVIFVRGIGLVYLNIEILRSGQLIAIIQLATKFAQAQKFLASVEFFSDNSCFSYNTRLTSVRDGISGLLQKKLCFTLSKRSLRNICINRKFNCRLRLSKFNELDLNILTVPNVDQINTIAGIRQSLIGDPHENKCVNNVETTSSNSVPEHHAINHVLEQFEVSLRRYIEGAISGGSIEIPNGSTSPQFIIEAPESTTSSGRRRRNRRNRRGGGTSIAL